MKQQYEEIMVDLIVLEHEDIITTSGELDDSVKLPPVFF